MNSTPSSQYQTSTMPWQTNDLRKLEQAISAIAVQADTQNRRWAQKWFEVFQFVLGNHYLKWSNQFGFAMDSDFMTTGNGGQDGANYQNRSQTNISRTVVESLATTIFAQLPDIFCEPKYDASSHGRRLAKTIDSLIKTYDERLNMHEELDSASVIFAMYSKAYASIKFNRVKGATFKRPKQQLTKVPKMTTRMAQDPVTGEQVTIPVPVMDANQQPVMIDTYENMVGPDGKMITEYARGGDADIEILTPFEIMYDPMCKTFAKAKWIQQVRIMDYDSFMTEYGDDPGVIAENIDKIKPGIIATTVKNMAIRHFMRTIFAIPPTVDSTGYILSSMLAIRNKVFVIEHHDRPTEGHRKNQTPWLSEGRRSVIANGKLCVVSTPQYRMNTDIGWHPYTECKWLPLPPSNHASGPMSDTVQKNRELNLTDSMMSLSIQRNCGASLLVHENSGLDKNKFTGEPGKTYYTSMDPGSSASWLSDRQPLPPLVQQYRQTVKDDIYEVGAAQDSIRGERSIGANSGYQARIYEERERKRTSKAANNWKSFVKNIYMKKIACLQQNVAKFDPDVISRMLRSADGDITEADIMSFLNGPIDFGVDITITPDSMVTKSKATAIADIQEAMQNPAVAARMMQDPSVVDAYLEFLGIDVLRDVSSTHRDRAKREYAIFMDMLAVKDPSQLMQAFGNDMPVVLWEDDDLLHILEHRRDMVKNFEKYKNNPILLGLMEIHNAKHEQNYKAKGGTQSPWLASTAEQMLQRAEQLEAQPKNLMEEIKKVTEMRLEKAMEAAQQAAPTNIVRNPAPAPEAGA